MTQFIELFNSVKNCPKCGARQTMNVDTGRFVAYHSERNILRVVCPTCGFIWSERCADGTDPKDPAPLEFVKFEYPLIRRPDGSFVEMQDSIKAMRERLSAGWAEVQERLKKIAERMK